MWEFKWHIRMANNFGGVAQLGEHLPCTQGVRSSILLISTTPAKVKDPAQSEMGS